MSVQPRAPSPAPRWRLRIGLSVLAILGTLLIYTILYRWFMATFEGISISYLHAFRIVVEVLTTAGFGGDTQHWQSAPLHLLVIVMNLTAVLFVFLVIPVFGIPMLRQALDPHPPIESSLTGHVILCGYSPQDEVLRGELEPRGIPTLYIDEDPEVVIELNEEGVEAMMGNPEELAVLEAANTASARAIVADIGDERNPTIILSAKRLNPDLRAISVVRDHESEAYQRYAGADEVVLARYELGKSLGMRASATFAEKLTEAVHSPTDLQFVELLVEPGSSLVGQSIREATELQDAGVTVLGAWVGAKFIVSPPPDTELSEHSILLVAGTQKEFKHVKVRPIVHEPSQPDRVIILGYGSVGWSARQALLEHGMDVTVVDWDLTKADVDVHGDVRDPETLQQADLSNARAVVLTLDDDTTAIFATLVINELAPSIEVIARVQDPNNIWKLYNAGADFVLSLVSETGEILARMLTGEDEILTADVEFQFHRYQVPAFDGRTLSELGIRNRTGCTVVAIERNGRVITEVTGRTVLQAADTLILAGSEHAHEEFDHELQEESWEGGSA